MYCLEKARCFVYPLVFPDTDSDKITDRIAHSSWSHLPPWMDRWSRQTAISQVGSYQMCRPNERVVRCTLALRFVRSPDLYLQW